MALTINTAKSLLRQIVGGAGFTSSNSWLALSSTKPDPSGTSSGSAGNYNITEPAIETSYNRVQLNGCFNSDATGATVDGIYTVSIKNNIEIHFPEALQNWGTYKYFAIFDSADSTTPKYVGELLKFTKDTEVTSENYANKVATGLYYFDTEAADYVKITVEVYDESKTYYFKDASGITIEEGTVPLVRKGYLKISVQ